MPWSNVQQVALARHQSPTHCEAAPPSASMPHTGPAWLPLLPQISPHDAFGQQMLLNLESRGCALLGIEGEWGVLVLLWGGGWKGGEGAGAGCGGKRGRMETVRRPGSDVGPWHSWLRRGVHIESPPCSSARELQRVASVRGAVLRLRCRLPIIRITHPAAATPSLDAQRQRFLDCGWQRAEARSMDHVYG